MKSISLYQFKSDEIKISVDARFDGDQLIIEGYDIGKRVEAYWGDSDYEYTMTIPVEGVNFLFQYFKIEPREKELLLVALAKRFNTNSCYSDIAKLLDENHIKYEGFSWS